MVKETAKTALRLFPSLYRKTALWHFKRNYAPANITHRFREKIASLDENSIAIDLGANIGLITAMMAKTGARVIAFEPNAAMFGELQKVGAKFPNVELLKVAAGTKNGYTYLYKPEITDREKFEVIVTSSLLDNMPSVSSQTKEKVRQIDFAEFLLNFKERIDIIKVDIEGYEITLLNYLLDKSALTNVDMLSVETHDQVMPEMRNEIEKLKARIRKELPGTEIEWI